MVKYPPPKKKTPQQTDTHSNNMHSNSTFDFISDKNIVGDEFAITAHEDFNKIFFF